MCEVAISADGVPIHYEVHGHGSPALVFVHGWCCNRNHWRNQVEHFARQYTVVTLDLAGHGESGQNRDVWNTHTFGQDVVAVVEELDLNQVVLVGHLMGGPVIVEAARRMPDRVIGLVGADTFRDLEQTRTREEIEADVAPLRSDFVNTAREQVRAACFVPASDPALVEVLVEDVAAASPQVGIGWRTANVGRDAELRSGLQEVQAPVYAINSDYRPTDLDATRRHGVDVLFMSGVGHFVMMEDPDTFNRLLEGVIKRLPGEYQSPVSYP